MQQWHVYEDWTTENVQRCFYVGKGDDDRIARRQRNRYHVDVASLYGYDRRVVLTTIDETEALELERRLIKERHTHPKDPEYNGIGCNRTLGGQGNSGRIVSEETCRKISEAKKGVPKSEFEKRRISEGLQKPEVKKARSEARKGLKLSPEWRQHIVDGMNDPVVKQNMIVKVTASIRAKYANAEFRQHVRETSARGEANGQSKFTDECVIRMRNEWRLVDTTIKGNRRTGKSPSWLFCQRWAEELGVTSAAIYAVVTHKTWRHLL